MTNWKEIVRQSREDEAKLSAKEEKTKQDAIAEAEAEKLRIKAREHAQELINKVEADDIFKKFSVRETLESIKRDVWKEGEIVERYFGGKGEGEGEVIGEITLRTGLPKIGIVSHWSEYTSGSGPEGTHTSSSETIDGISIAKGFAILTVMYSVNNREHFSNKKGKALELIISPFILGSNFPSPFKVLKRSEVSRIDDFYNKSPGRSNYPNDLHRRVYIDDPDSQSEFRIGLVGAIEVSSTPQQIRESIDGLINSLPEGLREGHIPIDRLQPWYSPDLLKQERRANKKPSWLGRLRNK